MAEANVTTISTPKKLYDPSTILSRPVKMTTGSTLDLKRGMIVMLDAEGKAYKAVAPGTLEFTSKLPATRCVVALEDAALTTSPVEVNAIVAGTVYVQALRDLGYTSKNVTMDALDVLGGLSNIRFVEEV